MLDASVTLWALGSASLAGAPSHHPEPAHVMRGHSAAVLCVAVSSVLRIAASGSRDGTAALYTLRDGRRVRSLREPNGASVEQLLLTDGGFVVLGGAAGTRLHLLTLNGLPVWSVPVDAGLSALALSPCGGALVCGFEDGALSVWSLHERQPLVQYAAAPAPVVVIAATEQHLLVGTSRAELLVYPPPSGAWTLPSRGFTRPPAADYVAKAGL